jgi:hypothetical protein
MSTSNFATIVADVQRKVADAKRPDPILSAVLTNSIVRSTGIRIARQSASSFRAAIELAQHR